MANSTATAANATMEILYFLNGTMIPDGDTDVCTVSTCPISYGVVEYRPNVAGNILYAALFGMLLVGQIGLGIYYRTWGFLAAVGSGLILEVIGYIGRIMLHSNPFTLDNFLVYLVPLTIGPAFMTAGIYLCLGRIVVVYGEHLSRVKPRTYTLMFVTFDFISLVAQAAGGAITSIADADQVSLSDDGRYIMIAGLAFQVLSLLIFIALCAEFAMRVRARQGEWNLEHQDLWMSRRWKGFLVGTFSPLPILFCQMKS